MGTVSSWANRHIRARKRCDVRTAINALVIFRGLWGRTRSDSFQKLPWLVVPCCKTWISRGCQSLIRKKHCNVMTARFYGSEDMELATQVTEDQVMLLVCSPAALAELKLYDVCELFAQCSRRLLPKTLKLYATTPEKEHALLAVRYNFVQ